MTMMSMMVMMTTAMMMVTMHNFAVYLFVPKLGVQILGWNREETSSECNLSPNFAQIQSNAPQSCGATCFRIYQFDLIQTD